MNEIEKLLVSSSPCDAFSLFDSNVNQLIISSLFYLHISVRI